MTSTARYLKPTGFVLVGMLAACAQQSVVEPAPIEVAEPAETKPSKVKLQSPITTVKPGALVTFSHPGVKSYEVGENASVTITVNEGYPTGTLTLEASGDPGLEVFGANKIAQMDMADVTTHSWRVDFQPQSDGVFYVNVLATARPNENVVETRAFAVRVNAGDWANAKTEAPMPMEILDDGTPAVMLKADETVE